MADVIDDLLALGNSALPDDDDEAAAAFARLYTDQRGVVAAELSRIVQTGALTPG